jgi:hypothetical protein
MGKWVNEYYPIFPFSSVPGVRGGSTMIGRWYGANRTKYKFILRINAGIKFTIFEGTINLFLPGFHGRRSQSMEKNPKWGHRFLKEASRPVLLSIIHLCQKDLSLPTRT